MWTEAAGADARLGADPNSTADPKHFPALRVDRHGPRINHCPGAETIMPSAVGRRAICPHKKTAVTFASTIRRKRGRGFQTVIRRCRFLSITRPAPPDGGELRRGRRNEGACGMARRDPHAPRCLRTEVATALPRRPHPSGRSRSWLRIRSIRSEWRRWAAAPRRQRRVRSGLRRSPAASPTSSRSSLTLRAVRPRPPRC
jgi:hypothetical protein